MTELKTLKDLKIFKWNDDEYENMDITSEEYSEGKQGTLLRDYMNKTKFTTIQISDEVWTKLNSRRGRNESFNLVVKRLLEKEDGTKIRTRKNI